VYSDAKGRSLFAVRVEGDSMEPMFLEGDLAIINPHIEASPGNYVLAKTKEGDATLKRFMFRAGIAVLEPLNPSYEHIALSPNIRIVGKVVEKKRVF